MSQNYTHNCNVDQCNTSPFTDLTDCISYFRNANPARSKSVNFFEIEPHGRRDAHISYAPDDLWASITLAINNVLGLQHPAQQAAYRLYEIERYPLDKVARLLVKHPRTIRRWVDKISDELDRELIKRGLIPGD